MRALPGPADPASVLLVCDDPLGGAGLAADLAADRMAVHLAAGATEAASALRGLRPEAVVVDLRAPGPDALDLIARIRAAGPGDPWDPAVPVVVISPRPEPHQAVRAIEGGADDHLTHPLDYLELLARLRLHVRRARGLSPAGRMRVGPLTVDRHNHSAVVNGHVLPLSAKELAMLSALAREPRRVLTKEELLRDVWGYQSMGRTRTVDSHASRLRRKLAAACPDQRFVTNVWGVGYRLLPGDA